MEPTQEQYLMELQEALSAATRALEDQAWTNLMATDTDLPGLSDADRPALRSKAKELATKNPMVKHAQNLVSWFTFGQGVQAPQIKHDDETTATKAQEVIDEFWRDPDNEATLTSYIAQDQACRKAQNEGDLFLMFFVDETNGTTKVRIPDANEITDIVFDPDDRNRPLYYVRKSREQGFNFKTGNKAPRLKTRVDYYRDVRYDEWEENLTPNERDAKVDYIGKATQEPFVYHQKINADTNDKWGVPDAYAALDWVRAQKTMVEDLATLVKALSMLAWKKTVKGTAAQVASAATALSPQAIADGGSGNPAPRTGSTVIRNEGVDWESVRADTGGVQNAVHGIRQIGLMVAVSFSLSEHFFGNGENANLASATAMELPVLRKFEACQAWWAALYIAACRFVLSKSASRTGVDPDKVWEFTIDVDFPPLVTKDVKTTVDAIGGALMAGTMTAKQAATLTLNAFGVNNIDAEIEELFPEGEQVIATAEKKQLVSVLRDLKECAKEMAGADNGKRHLRPEPSKHLLMT